MLEVVSFAERHARLAAILNRRTTFDEKVDSAVRDVIGAVRGRGDAALREFSARFDGVDNPVLNVPEAETTRALSALDGGLRSVIEEATANIRRFHEHQRRDSWYVEDGDDVVLGQRVIPLQRVGLYVPGGTAFYPSSLLMNAIPAQVAGVEEIHVASPPESTGLPNVLVLATAALLGIRHVHAVGGAQAIAALAYGTESIPAVDKIVGPGNAYVAAAKRMVYGPVDIDAIAGPTEIVVLADDTADAEFVAADLLSQAEHDVRASAILITPSRGLAEAVVNAVRDLARRLERIDIVTQSLADYGACVVTATMDESIELVNTLAPEHLELHVEAPWDLLPRIRNAGAVFLGSYSPEPVGDYFAGPNHVLPTGGTARFASPLGVDDFVKRQSVVGYSEKRLRRDGAKIARFAEAEGLGAHALAIRVRLDRGAEPGV
ncbi:MAG TPA: histidinol dehydrogenase [Rhodothermales bacterium]